MWYVLKLIVPKVWLFQSFDLWCERSVAQHALCGVCGELVPGHRVHGDAVVEGPPPGGGRGVGPHPAHHLRLQVEGELDGLEAGPRAHRAVLYLQPEEAGHGVTLSVGGHTGVVSRVARSYTL